RVAGEHARCDARGAVVDDQGQVLGAGFLDARGDAGCPKALRGDHALGPVRHGVGGHGATPVVGRPEVSGRPRARLRHCTAAPAVPLVRLSIAAMTTSRRASVSTATCRARLFEPRVAFVVGQEPSGRTCTNGSSPYVLS